MSLFGKITLGCDPEVLLTKGKQPFGAKHTGITGTKENPEKTEYGAIQVDGMALEYNINPATSLSSWIKGNNKAMRHISVVAGKNGFSMSKKSILDYSKYIKLNSPTVEETMFGCDPDYNADTMAENVMPDNDGSITIRTAGGHVHIGMENWPTMAINNEIAHRMAQKVIYVCDLVLGLWSVLHDQGEERKQLYGKAGAYRLKSYGVEYRTLSNFWVFNEDTLTYVYNTLMNALTDFHRLSNFATEHRKDIVKAINHNDKSLAQKLLMECA